MSTLTKRPTGQQPEWVSYLEDMMGVRLYDDKWQRWKRWIADTADGLGEDVRDSEILATLRFIHSKKEPVPDKFTVKKLISWIKWYRKEECAARKGYRTDTPEGKFRERKYRIGEAKTWLERWEIVCEPNSDEECQQLDDYCRQLWPEWPDRVADIWRDIAGKRLARKRADVYVDAITKAWEP